MCGASELVALTIYELFRVMIQMNFFFFSSGDPGGNCILETSIH